MPSPLPMPVGTENSFEDFGARTETLSKAQWLKSLLRGRGCFKKFNDSRDLATMAAHFLPRLELFNGCERPGYGVRT